MKTSIRHSLLLPLNGNTKGKLLCGRKLEILEHTRPVDENNKSQKMNNAITWRDFYRPPGSKPKPNEKLLQLSQSTTNLPTQTTVQKDSLLGMSNFLRSTLTARDNAYTSKLMKSSSGSTRKSKSGKAVTMQQS